MYLIKGKDAYLYKDGRARRLDRKLQFDLKVSSSTKKARYTIRVRTFWDSCRFLNWIERINRRIDTRRI